LGTNSVTHQYDSADREKEAALAASDDTGDDDSHEQQRNPYQELDDRLNWVGAKWRHRKSKWFTTPMEVAALSLGFLTLFSVIAAAIFAYSQLNIMREQLRLTHRAWLQVEVAATPLRIYETAQHVPQAEVVLSLTLRNSGTAPVIRAIPVLDLDFFARDVTGFGIPLSRPAASSICQPEQMKNYLRDMKVGSGLISPNSEAQYAAQLRLQESGPWPSPTGLIGATVSGCVGYLDDTGEPHATFVDLLLLGDFKPIIGTTLADRKWSLTLMSPNAY
jgi:hypothetical protein